ncbi:Uncharacterised protein [Chlamydia trachomatis]|nr:Uncharacterised protein [Chlamydia trachomatis]
MTNSFIQKLYDKTLRIWPLANEATKELRDFHVINQLLENYDEYTGFTEV